MREWLIKLRCWWDSKSNCISLHASIELKALWNMMNRKRKYVVFRIIVYATSHTKLNEGKFVIFLLLELTYLHLYCHEINSSRNFVVVMINETIWIVKRMSLGHAIQLSACRRQFRPSIFIFSCLQSFLLITAYETFHREVS